MTRIKNVFFTSMVMQRQLQMQVLCVYRVESSGSNDQELTDRYNVNSCADK